MLVGPSLVEERAAPFSSRVAPKMTPGRAIARRDRDGDAPYAVVSGHLGRELRDIYRACVRACVVMVPDRHRFSFVSFFALPLPPVRCHFCGEISCRVLSRLTVCGIFPLRSVVEFPREKSLVSVP